MGQIRRTSFICKKSVCSSVKVNNANVSNLKIFSTPLVGNNIHIKVGNQSTQALVDSGADISCISLALLKRAFPKIQIQTSNTFSVNGVCGEVHLVLGQIQIPIKLNGLILEQRFQVFERLHNQIVLGMDFLKNNQAEIKFTENVLTLHDGFAVVPLASPKSHCSSAKLDEDVTIPPHTQATVKVTIPKISNGSTVCLEPAEHLYEAKLIGSKCVSNVHNSFGVYQFINPTNTSISLTKHTTIAHISSVTDQDITALVEKPTHSNTYHNTHKSKEQLIEIAKDLGISLENSQLTESQKEQLLILIGKHRKSFAKDLSEIGKTNLTQHAIHTGNSRPVSSPNYRRTPEQMKIIEEITKEMLEQGIVEESDSCWHSPVVLVKKKPLSPDQPVQYRFAVDFRKLNAMTDDLHYPLPRLDDIFDTIGDAKANIFSTLDLASGFWQIPLDPTTKHKSAFITHQGVFQFKRLPFGLKNAPMSFQALMGRVLQNMNFKTALVYIDDILIFSQTFEEHLQHLDTVFSTLAVANLTLKPAKCNFAAKEVKYLGHILSKDGISVDYEKTRAISEFPQPKSQKQVRSFLGMCNYYRKFVKNFAATAVPLNALLHKDSKFIWTDKCQVAFDTLKQNLVSAPILAFPDFHRPFIVSTDASDSAIGYILGQLDEDGKREHAIAYGGRSLNTAEKKWHINEKEALALVEAINMFRPYLETAPFTVFTDNISVKWLQESKNLNSRIGRWAMRLQGYNFQIKHRAGVKNQNADGLSRRDYDVQPTKQSSPDTEADLPDIPGIPYTAKISQVVANQSKDVSMDVSSEVLAVTLEYHSEEPVQITVAPVTTDTDDIDDNDDNDNNDRNQLFWEMQTRPGLRQLQEQCPDFCDIFKYKMYGMVPIQDDLARKVVAESYNYEIIDGILHHFHQRRYRNVPKADRLIRQLAIPRTIRDEVLKAYHDCTMAGHQGQERTYEAIRTKYFWPKMYQEIKDYVQSCTLCQQTKRDIHGKPTPLQPLPVDDVFGRWHMDILGGLPTTKEGYKYILLVVDSASKWSEAFPMKTQSAAETANILFREIFTRYGAPRALVSDRGQNFMSTLVQALSEMFQIKRVYTSSYHPQTNAVCERMNSVILQGLRTYCTGNQTDWIDVLPAIMMAYRMTPATQSTQHSPFYLLFGKDMRMPIDATLIPNQALPAEFRHQLSQHLKHLEISRKIAKENMEIAQHQYKRQHDKRAEDSKFKVGDRVWLYCTQVPKGHAPKLHKKWIGPYNIESAYPNNTFTLRRCSNNKPVRSRVNASRLKPYFDPARRPTNPPQEYDNETDEAELNAEEFNNENDNQRDNQNTPDTSDDLPTQTQANSQDGGDNSNQTQQSVSQDQDAVPAPARNNNTKQATNRNKQTDREDPSRVKQTSTVPLPSDQIEKILCSKRSGNKLWYRILYKDRSIPSAWLIADLVPAEMKINFHENKNMTGKVRRRPLRQNKFFQQSQNVNMIRSERRHGNPRKQPNMMDCSCNSCKPTFSESSRIRELQQQTILFWLKIEAQNLRRTNGEKITPQWNAADVDIDPIFLLDLCKTLKLTLI